MNASCVSSACGLPARALVSLCSPAARLAPHRTHSQFLSRRAAARSVVRPPSYHFFLQGVAKAAQVWISQSPTTNQWEFANGIFRVRNVGLWNGKGRKGGCWPPRKTTEPRCFTRSTSSRKPPGARASAVNCSTTKNNAHGYGFLLIKVKQDNRGSCIIIASILRY